MPRYVGSGTWKLYGAELGDRAGNYKSYGYRRLGELGFDRDLAVVSRVDAHKPEIRRLSLTPGSVDVRTADQTVTMKLRVRDVQSGVRSVQAWFWSGGIGHDSRLHLVAGTRRDGTWKGTFTVHRCTARAGGLRAEVLIRDRSGNEKNYGTTALAEAGWRSKIAVTATDHTVPWATINETVPRTGPLKVTFSQSVNGITLTAPSCDGCSTNGSKVKPKARCCQAPGPAERELKALQRTVRPARSGRRASTPRTRSSVGLVRGPAEPRVLACGDRTWLAIRSAASRCSCGPRPEPPN